MNKLSKRRVILVTGPARSGKSEWAESLAQESGKSVIYVATAQKAPDDAEWMARISQHIQRRPSVWQTWEVPVNLGATIESAKSSNCLLVDSLGTWVANLLEYDRTQWQKILKELLEIVENCNCDVIFVAEETGWGVVPAYPAGRLFRDRLGTLVRQLGAIANPTYLVTAGHVLNLSQLGSPLNNK
ncbi:bifunctional adenosylcobinamide kinase/adenosylcobinamide-phosphate guanylyltransferase [Phormidium sp. LEGE 05292]|uniref:bifunctional adenosylcobinamide kinase/adenosylcobinamide-phosphate guanylyltransferase n=1 Tax=[Phormidium] sp. LEGE 05292 TaxID=767427 RepID=UPI0018807C2E|nr:bifunctional adenosylcobinamide kinase/adenosylcobinamide-phosphate guanylyltransferase [Phormidium sp. LEGE 05292]MBE9223966.1 bifunctional adenosylcobinamide kinase/adenosylcobinamide-phosphate guanylyltransferase [Phormidium sp. LEGE 05292]